MHQNINYTGNGITIWDCRNCKIIENNISNNRWGIFLLDSKECRINYNNFVANKRHAIVASWKGIYHNNWNRNYWKRLIFHWPGFIPKIIHVKNVDWLPLMKPYRWWNEK